MSEDRNPAAKAADAMTELAKDSLSGADSMTAARGVLELAGAGDAEKKTIVTPPSQIVIAKGFRVSETSQGPTSKRARFTCEACKGTAYVEIPWDATAQIRSSLMKEAVDEHRYVCPVGLPEDMRTYRIHYPR